jgi:hypothetical protein
MEKCVMIEDTKLLETSIDQGIERREVKGEAENVDFVTARRTLNKFRKWLCIKL